MSGFHKYVDVILPLPLKGVFTYYIDEKNVLLGQRVIVQFGARKLYTAVVISLHDKKPLNYNAKPVLAILDEAPIVNSIQLKFWTWISDYYMCNLGDVMNATLPTSFKLASESKVIVHPNFDGDLELLKTNEINLLNVFSEQEELSITEISKLIDVKSVFPFINELIRKEILQIKENIYDKYKPKIVKRVRYIATDKMLRTLKLTSKQELFVKSYLDLQKQNLNKIWLVSDLLKKIGFSRAIFNTLVSKGVFSIEIERVSRLLRVNQSLMQEKTLVDFQKKALNEIKICFKTKPVCLLHGVTSSGKTELYIKLIQEELDKGKQVLYLLPEIALTNQIIKRLQKHFGDKVGVTHSHLNNSERVEVWKAVQEKNDKKMQYPIMLGARSSLFLPFNNLGLIVIDEEHDSSFKQHQPSPRYHARDAAIYLAHLHQAKVLLGSATPCVETYYNAKKEKYGLVEMQNRFQGIELPRMHIIDIKKIHLKKQMIYQFSPQMLNAIKETLNNGKQVILFQNKRGYAPVLICRTCAYIPSCEQCDVSLTYHKGNNHLKCHYCGSTQEFLEFCTSCNSKDFIDKGFGTEQIEESLKELFPKNISKRMDYDTTRGKNSHQKIITDFEKGRIDILVGTQMITKGLDFNNVAMVGILNADNMISFPDFRSYERAFQLMMQVAGRAGRKGNQGQVFIQTHNEKHSIFKMLQKNDFISFIKRQIIERKEFNYPPYSRLVQITLKHKNKKKLDEASLQLGVMMRHSFGKRVLGPEYPVISRIRNYYHKNLLLKIEQKDSITQAKKILNTIVESFQNHISFKSIRYIIDIDPV